jgi:hypothetical protein
MLFQRKHLVLNHLHDRKIAVNDEIQDGVQNVVGPHPGSALKLFSSMDIRGVVAMAYRYDVPLAQECVDSRVLDLIAFQASHLQHHENLVFIDVQFRRLHRAHRVLYSQAMQPEPFLQDREVVIVRVERFDPD